MTEAYIDGEMSLREEVEAHLQADLVEALYASIGGQSAFEQFRRDLVRLLTRYELYREAAKGTPRKERRAQVAKLRDKASAFVDAIDALSSDVVADVETQLMEVNHETRLAGWTFESGDPFPDGEESIATARQAADDILTACQIVMGIFEEAKGAKKGSENPALDQLLSDLAALFEAGTGRSAQSQCYRDDIAEDGYNGAFFVMVKRLLDSYAPKSYGTPAALGIRILRVLKEDR